ncbi:hypothetical protein GN156_02550 [bacterium LRH843]|nr:hypothetical protein [bacterium LRH843]
MSNNLYNPLLGRVVQLYKGGPEKTVGTLVDVKDDFLIVQTADGQMIFFTLEHIKSIIEDSQTGLTLAQTSVTNTSSDTVDLTDVTKFNELMTNFIGKKVRINRKGPESKEGTLIAVQGNFFVLFTKKEGLLFYTTYHIKSISEVAKATEEGTDENKEGKDESAEQEENQNLDEITNIYNEIAADKFHQFLTNLQYRWVKVNRHGPESLEGMLVDSSADFLTMVVKNEVLRLPVSHVKSISSDVTLNKGDQQENSEQQSNNEKGSKSANLSKYQKKMMK